jgi:uncharacterized Zn finger protein
MNLLFKCFSCHQNSPFDITSANRDEVKRVMGDSQSLGKVNFICASCGTVNLIEIDFETASQVLARLSSEDPQIQNAINKAKEGDYSDAIKAAKDKFGFRF